MRKVPRNAMYVLAEQLASGGKYALRTKRLGHPPALDAAKRTQLMRLLKQDTLAQGHAIELWTLARMAEMIARHFQSQLPTGSRSFSQLEKTRRRTRPRDHLRR